MKAGNPGNVRVEIFKPGTLVSVNDNRNKACYWWRQIPKKFQGAHLCALVARAALAGAPRLPFGLLLLRLAPVLGLPAVDHLGVGSERQAHRVFL